MTRSELLSFVSRRIPNGNFSTVLLSALSAIERVTEDSGNMPHPAFEAAVLASLVPSTSEEDLKAFHHRTLEILQLLQTPTHTSDVERLHCALHLHHTSFDADVRDAAIAFVLAELEVAVSTQANLKCFVSVIAKMMRQERRPSRLRVLDRGYRIACADRVRSEEPRSFEPPRVLSISVDICDSTYAKTQMEKTKTDHEHLHRMYQEYYSSFLREESALYDHLFHHPTPNCRTLDWKKTFVVKGLGDEIWILYEVPQEEFAYLNSIAVTLMHALAELAQHHVHWTSTRKLESPVNHAMRSDAYFSATDLPIKVYLDLFQDTFEISNLRTEHFRECLDGYLTTTTMSNSMHTTELAYRLNAGTSSTDKHIGRASNRMDFVGHEVDVFFRAAKCALPHTVTVGSSLFSSLVSDSRRTSNSKIHNAVIDFPLLEEKHEHCRDFYYVESSIDPSRLKGIEESYNVYHFTRRKDLYRLRQVTESATEFHHPAC